MSYECMECGEHPKHGECQCTDKDAKLQAAREAVISAAKVCDENRVESFAFTALYAAVADLRKLEQPPDPLEPALEFVKLCLLEVNEDYAHPVYCAKLKAAAKALGMEDK